MPVLFVTLFLQPGTGASAGKTRHDMVARIAALENADFALCSAIIWFG
jgi:hypothetical protein